MITIYCTKTVMMSTTSGYCTNTSLAIDYIIKKSLEIPKGQSESVYRRRTDNTMAKKKKYKRTNNDPQNIHIKLKTIFSYMESILVKCSEFYQSSLFTFLMFSQIIPSYYNDKLITFVCVKLYTPCTFCI